MGGRRLAGRQVGVGAAAVVGILVVLGSVLAPPPLATRPSPSPSLEVTPVASTPAKSTVDRMLERVRTVYFEVFDGDRTDGTADDLTPAKLDSILRAAEAEDATAQEIMMGQLTVVIFSLTSSELGEQTDGEAICPTGVVGVGSIPGAIDIFGEAEPTIATVVANTIGSWTGRLEGDRDDWTFGYGDVEADVVARVLTGMNEGRLILSDGCP